MSRILEATCVGGVVTVDSLPIPGTDILSEGVGDSEGWVILDGDKRAYLPKTTPDLDSTLEQTIDALTSIASTLQTIALTLTSIGAGMTGPTTAPPPTLAANVATIATDVAAITAAKAQLTTLKGMLK